MIHTLVIDLGFMHLIDAYFMQDYGFVQGYILQWYFSTF